MTDTMFADAMGFLGPQGQPPLAIPELWRNLRLVICTAARPTDTTWAETLKQIEGFRKTIESQPHLKLILTLQDLEALRDLEGVTGVVLSLQNMPYTGTKITKAVKTLDELGVRVLTPCYQSENMFGGGFLAPDVELTAHGVALLEVLGGIGTILDLSHVGETTVDGILSHAENLDNTCPELMASHGGVSNIYGGATDPERPRNLPLGDLKRIAAKGGVVGLYTLTFGLSPSRDDLNPFREHLTSLIRHVGSANCCLGSDAVYQELDEKKWREHTEEFMIPNIDPEGLQGARWPDFPLELNGPWRTHYIKAKMGQWGFHPQEVRDFMGESLYRFLNGAFHAWM